MLTFHQIVDHQEIFSGVRVVDRPLTEDQMMGEVLSILLGNSRVSCLFIMIFLGCHYQFKGIMIVICFYIVVRSFINVSVY